MDRFQHLGLLGFAAGDLPADALDQLQARARQVRPLEPGPEVDGLLLQLGAAPASNETVQAARERWRLCLEVLDAFLAGEPRHRVSRAAP